MTARRVDHLLVGGGLASAHCAARLRKLGADGSILLVGREPEPPYDRPPLSKQYLRGEQGREDGYVRPLDWYEQNDVELLLETSVMSLDAEGRAAKLSSGEEVEFGSALLATGANVRLLRVEGAQLEGIHYLRAFGNADAIAQAAEDADRIVLVGGSYIACEVAASLTAMGRSCAMVMLEDVALSGSFGDDVGRYFHELLISNGIEIHAGEEVAEFAGDGGRVAGVRTASGKLVEGGAVVVGAGVVPDTMLAKRAGLEVDDGIVCDATLATSADGIWAAGDVASYESRVHGRRLRIEHWDVAMRHGQAVAAAMLGDAEPFVEVPYFWSDLADWAGLEYVGPAEAWEEVVWRGHPGEGEFTAWYLQGGRLVAALAVGRSEDLVHARRWLEQGADLGSSREALGDPGTELDAIGA